MLGSLGPLPAAREGDTVSLAVFALVVVIWVALLVPLSRRGRAELAAEASEGGSRLSSGGAPPWTRRRRILLLLVVATAAGSRAWAVLGGRWWLAAAVAGALLAGYLLTLTGLGWRRARRRRALTAGTRRAPGRRERWAPPAPGGGQVPLSTE